MNHAWCPYNRRKLCFNKLSCPFAIGSIIHYHLNNILMTDFINHFIKFAMKYLSLISPEQSTYFRNIDLPLEIAMKFINGLLCESLQPSLTIFYDCIICFCYLHLHAMSIIKFNGLNSLIGENKFDSILEFWIMIWHS